MAYGNGIKRKNTVTIQTATGFRGKKVMCSNCGAINKIDRNGKHKGHFFYDIEEAF
ncbi:MAG: hypothetical protein ACOC80_00760 [Petrotogales bacterium]